MIILRSNACLREQIGGKGYFAEVSVNAEITEDGRWIDGSNAAEFEKFILEVMK